MTTSSRTRSARLSATAADLPPAVAAALAAPTPGTPGWVESGGDRWATLSWGQPTDPPILLIHGVTSNAGIWWRVGPALAASGRRVVAIDMPGHGQTQAWHGRHRWSETADDVAGFIRAAGLDRPDLAVVGHSWGAMVTAHLPIAGIRPRALVLVDPPVLTLEQLELLTRDPTERPYATLGEATTAVRKAYPTWSDGDIDAKAQALTEFNAGAVLAVLLQNGDYDAGMAALRDPRAAGVPAWLIRGEWATGCFIPDTAVPALVDQLGADRVITIEGAPHSPQRTHPEATVLALLRALA
jgi:Predicted hydrolases or acyltransferases (alpha/beta hydrolase superfamily)